MLVYKNKVLVRKNEKKLMKDLYEFPYFSCSEFPIKISAVQKWVHETFSSPVVYQKTLSSQKHTFTHFRVELFPFLFSFETKKEIDSYSWVEKKQLYALPFSAGHRKIKEDLFAHTSY